MPITTTSDGTEISYEDWEEGQPVVFSHRWPLCADAWDGQLLHQIDVPVLVAHGDDDQIVPYANSAPETAQLLKDAEPRTYAGQPHGLYGAYERTFDTDLLAYARA